MYIYGHQSDALDCPHSFIQKGKLNMNFPMVQKSHIQMWRSRNHLLQSIVKSFRRESVEKPDVWAPFISPFTVIIYSNSVYVVEEGGTHLSRKLMCFSCSDHTTEQCVVHVDILKIYIGAVRYVRDINRLRSTSIDTISLSSSCLRNI